MRKMIRLDHYPIFSILAQVSIKPHTVLGKTIYKQEIKDLLANYYKKLIPGTIKV